jgi:hypothetical protein
VVEKPLDVVCRRRRAGLPRFLDRCVALVLHGLDADYTGKEDFA